ncbi:MAG: hypothetical protein M1818_006294 [Claussenomyces sp. TS43310]|nr:MAG: hypothetical protein M1818_006294 [Claussenomyces sp. TS43310]
MSFASFERLSLDKEPDLFGQDYHDSSNDFLNQYLTFDSIETEDSFYPALPGLTHLERSPCSRQFLEVSSASREDDAGFGNVQELQDGPWDFAQNAASPQLVSTERANVYPQLSDSDLLSLEGISLQSPEVTPSSPSLPSTPLPKSPPVVVQSSRKKYHFLDSVSKTLSIPRGLRKVTLGIEKTRSSARKVTHGSEVNRLSPTRSPTRKVTCGPDTYFSSPTRSPIRKATSPAKMMRASQYSEQDLQEWSANMAADAAKFNFGFPTAHGPLSPPPSAKLSDASDNSVNMMPTNSHRSGPFQWDQPIPQYTGRSNTTHTPIATPTTSIHAFTQSNLQAAPGSDMMYTDGPQEHDAGTHWSTHNINLMGAEYDSFGPPQFPQEPETSPVWWNHASTAPMAQPSPALYHRSSSQDTKSLAMHLQSEVIGNANDLALSHSNFQNGLNIQLPHTPAHQSFVISNSPMQAPSEYFTTHPHVDPSAHHHYTHSQPDSRASPRIFGSLHSVRKSRSRGRICDTPSPTSGTPTRSFSVQKRRSSSACRHMAARPSEHHPTTPKTSKASRSASGFADFVNFTPSDSGKILTGVAPSGSSKTKARREKEAMEKRRRLSQAAVKAVTEAGGSLDSLKDLDSEDLLF